MSASSSRGRFLELDVFRGIAALAVVLYHYTFRFDQLYGLPDVATAVWRPGLYGVHFFFLISGFVITWSLSNATNLRGFVVSRFSRIYPAYWVALLLTFTIVAILGLPGREFDVRTLAINFSMIQEYLNVPHIDQAYWTLTTELTFYFWITLLYLGGRLHQAEFWFLPLMAISVLSFTGMIELPLRVSKGLLLTHANLFAAGIVLYRVYSGGGWRTARWFLPLCAATNLAIVPWYDAVLLASFMAVLALAVDGRLSWLCRAPLLWLGGISYTLYLLHQNIGYVIMRTVLEWGAHPWVAILGALALILLMAELLSRLVERPAARWLRQKTR